MARLARWDESLSAWWPFGGHLVACLVGCPSGNQAGCHQTAQPASHSMTPKIGWCSAAACLFTSQHATALSHRAGPCFTLALPPEAWCLRYRACMSNTPAHCSVPPNLPTVSSVGTQQTPPSRRHPADVTHTIARQQLKRDTHAFDGLPLFYAIVYSE